MHGSLKMMLGLTYEWLSQLIVNVIFTAIVEIVVVINLKAEVSIILLVLYL